MPHYLVQVAYNSGGAAAMVKEPQNRIEKVTPAVEELGGRVECGYFGFGDYDVILVCEMPDNAQRRGISTCGCRRRSCVVVQDDGPADARRGR